MKVRFTITYSEPAVLLKIIFIVTILSAVFQSCKKDDSSSYVQSNSFSSSNKLSDLDTEEDFYSDEISDGTYCAEVEYYNPNTGTRNTYELDVEVEDGNLTQINWPNGGWLDETHFYSEDISSGECSFTSDRGYRYTVTLGDKGGGCYSEGSRLQSDVNEDTENTTCPKCGDDKYEYDEYCYSCKRKIEEEQEEEQNDSEEY